MTQEAQRISIAKACGLSTDTHAVGGVFVYYDKNGHMHPSLPDYLTDLNAMHEAEKVLTDGQLCDYGCELQKITHEHRHEGETFWGRLAHATAAQRSEAFLRTIGKWIE